MLSREQQEAGVDKVERSAWRIWPPGHSVNVILSAVIIKCETCEWFFAKVFTCLKPLHNLSLKNHKLQSTSLEFIVICLHKATLCNNYELDRKLSLIFKIF
ncbi:hypothetical protein ILYODFUR_002072 [Ilyodon furcidens]|uniref:Uncharacterized protein n=1 Tax=Ilyodon furcidens TaxID=33524 RepID=A0ABV0VB04_9TELE